MNLDVASVLNGTGARAVDGDGHDVSLTAADLRHPISGVAVDSREVTLGALFFALRGERTDGHLFASDAGERGAAVVVVDHPVGLSTSATQLVVPDTLAALHDLARYWRSRHKITVLGITGSIGKTTTKEITASILGTRFRVLRNTSNRNTEIGMPLTLLELDDRHDVAVLEMGMYQPGDIALLAEIAQPEIGIVTMVAPIHLSRMGTIERIARAKSELVQALPSGGLAILNADDPWTRAMAISSGVADCVLVGFAEDADYRASDVEALGLDGVRFAVTAEGRVERFQTGVPGAHNVYAFLAAIVASRRLGMGWSEIREAVADVALDVRQRIVRGRDSLIIDDSYNAAPMSMSAALELLRAAPGHKIAVLGDMLELGPDEERAHRQVGEEAAGVAEWLIMRGMRTRWIAEAAERSGLPAERILHARTNDEVVEDVRTVTANVGQWALLVKGSRGLELEGVVQELEALL